MLVGALLGAIVLVAAACESAATSASPSEPAAPSVGPARLTAILGASGCEVEGGTEAVAGPVVIGLENGTDGRFDLDLWRIDDGHEYAELAAHIAEEMRRTEAGEEPLGHPTFADLVAETSAEGASGELRVDLEAGTYGFACIYFATPEAPSAFWAAGPLVVS